MSMFKIHKINFPNGKLITVKRKEHMTNTNVKNKGENRVDTVINKSKKIVKKLSKPKLTSEQVDKYISTQPINVMTNTVATLSVDRKEINWTDEKMEDSNKINMMNQNYILKNLKPNLTIVLKSNFKTIYSRINKRSKNNKFDKLKTNFYKKAQNAFLSLARKNKNYIVFDSSENTPDLEKKILSFVLKKIN